MITLLNHKDKHVAKNILQLQKAAYTVEADLIGFFHIPPLHDTIEIIQNCEEDFIGYTAHHVLAGVIAYEKNQQALTISRLMVHPSFFRKGIAGKLLAYIEELHPEMKIFKVTTGSKNTPAITLYQKAGFQEKGEIEVAPKVSLTKFEKLKNS